MIALKKSTTVSKAPEVKKSSKNYTDETNMHDDTSLSVRIQQLVNNYSKSVNAKKSLQKRNSFADPSGIQTAINEMKELNNKFSKPRRSSKR